MDVIEYFEKKVKTLEKTIESQNLALQEFSHETNRGLQVDLANSLQKEDSFVSQITLLEEKVAELEEVNFKLTEEKALLITQFETFARNKMKFKGSLKTFIEQVTKG